MKHILSLLTIALAFTATTVYAAFNYEVETWDYQNEWLQGYDYEYYKIKVTEGSGKLYITDFINNIYDSNQTDSIMQQGITRYGYYDVKGKTPGDELKESDLHVRNVTEADRIEMDSYKASEWHNAATRYGYELGTFSEGDEIAIWVEQGGSDASVGSYTAVYQKNTSRYDAYSVDTLAQFRNNWDYNAAKKAMPIAELTLYHSDGGSTQLRFGLQGIASAVPVVEQSQTFGSPLPGGLQISLIAGLFGLGFWYVRRKKVPVA